MTTPLKYQMDRVIQMKEDRDKMWATLILKNDKLKLNEIANKVLEELNYETN